MKLGIVIIVYNISSEITILQIEAIKKFCKDDYAIVIIDNSSDPVIAKDIEYHATRLGVNYKKTYPMGLSGSLSHSFAANLSYSLLKGKYDYFAYFDHDLIPVKDFSVVDILGEDKIIAGVGQHGRTYFWPGCLLFKKMDEVDFSPNNTLRLDTGGELRLIIEKYGEEACIFFNEAYVNNTEYTGKTYYYYAMINDSMFMHFVNGSEWNPVENNESRINSLLNIARHKIENNVD